MAEPEPIDRPPGLRETTAAAEGCARGQAEMLDLYLKCTADCIGKVQKLPSPKFNNKQCEYLVKKLEKVSRVVHHGPDVERHIEICKLMLGLAKEIESFILGCSEDAWIEAAMTLTTVSEYVASIGFNLELCRVAFCKNDVAAGPTGRLTLDQVMAVNNHEVGLVKAKALVDVENLSNKVLVELPTKSLNSEERDLAIYLLQRLKKVEPISPSVASGSSLYSVIDDKRFLRNLFKWVKPAERIGNGASAIVYKAKWIGLSVAKKTLEGRDNPDFMKSWQN